MFSFKVMIGKVKAINSARTSKKATINTNATCENFQCFKQGKIVKTKAGNKKIEDIAVGDEVLAYDEETGEQGWKSVVRLFRNKTEQWYHIFSNNEEIVCTAEHPFYVVGIGFVRARNLTINEKLLLSDRSYGIINGIEVEQLEVLETTYNFEVEDFHTYYVSNSGVCVHNTCIFGELDVKDFNEIGLKYTPEQLVNKLDDIGLSKTVTMQSAKSGP